MKLKKLTFCQNAKTIWMEKMTRHKYSERATPAGGSISCGDVFLPQRHGGWTKFMGRWMDLVYREENLLEAPKELKAWVEVHRPPSCPA